MHGKALGLNEYLLALRIRKMIVSSWISLVHWLHSILFVLNNSWYLWCSVLFPWLIQMCVYLMQSTIKLNAIILIYFMCWKERRIVGRNLWLNRNNNVILLLVVRLLVPVDIWDKVTLSDPRVLLIIEIHWWRKMVLDGANPRRSAGPCRQSRLLII